MIAFTEAWGEGRGYMRRLTPASRLLCGILAFTSCSVVPLENPYGVCLFFILILGWSAVCVFPLRRLIQALLLSACLFLPLLLLVPIACIQSDSGAWTDPLKAALFIGFRGTACIMICGASMSVLNLAEFGQGLAALPLPHSMAALLLQIVHQTATLADESRQMMMALRVRGVSSASVVVRLRCIFALPIFWLLRLLQRAEHVSSAMEVRGFDGLLHQDCAEQISTADRCARILAFLIFGFVLCLRLEFV